MVTIFQGVFSNNSANAAEYTFVWLAIGSMTVARTDGIMRVKAYSIPAPMIRENAAKGAKGEPLAP